MVEEEAAAGLGTNWAAVEYVHDNAMTNNGKTYDVQGLFGGRRLTQIQAEQGSQVGLDALVVAH